MYDRLKKLYDEGRVTSENLQVAVNYNWITAEEKEQIETVNQSIV